MEISPALIAEREKRVDLRRKKNDDYVAELRHKGLHNLSGEMGCGRHAFDANGSKVLGGTMDGILCE
jgi:hypothetical protein